MTAKPVFHGRLAERDHLRDPYLDYRQVRDLGPAVWLPHRKLWAIGRFEDVRAALRTDNILISGKGVAANSFVNSMAEPITLTSDGEVHARRRAVLMRPLMQGSLKDLGPRLEDEARRLVMELASAGTFDAMAGSVATMSCEEA